MASRSEFPCRRTGEGGLSRDGEAAAGNRNPVALAGKGEETECVGADRHGSGNDTADSRLHRSAEKTKLLQLVKIKFSFLAHPQKTTRNLFSKNPAAASQPLSAQARTQQKRLFRRAMQPAVSSIVTAAVPVSTDGAENRIVGHCLRCCSGRGYSRRKQPVRGSGRPGRGSISWRRGLNFRAVLQCDGKRKISFLQPLPRDLRRRAAECGRSAGRFGDIYASDCYIIPLFS